MKLTLYNKLQTCVFSKKLYNSSGTAARDKTKQLLNSFVIFTRINVFLESRFKINYHIIYILLGFSGSTRFADIESKTNLIKKRRPLEW